MALFPVYIIGGALWTAMVLLSGVQAKRVISPERPVVPNVTATSPTEIKMNWCRVKSNNVEIDHYELYVDSELEYSGIDVMYVAKRLKPWTAYEIKLRACGFHPGASCSPFSRPTLVKTLTNGDNYTAIQSTASVFKVVVVPTYIFIMGCLVGMVILAMALIWRYLQCNDAWTNDPPFELPQYIQQKKRQLETQHEHPQILLPIEYNISNTGLLTEGTLPVQDQDKSCYQIAENKIHNDPTPLSTQSISMQPSSHCVYTSDASLVPDGLSLQDELPFSVSVTKVDEEGQQFLLSIYDAQTKVIPVDEQNCDYPQTRERSFSNIEVKIIGNNHNNHSSGSSTTRPYISQAGCHGENTTGGPTIIYTQQEQQSYGTSANIHDKSLAYRVETEIVSETEPSSNDEFYQMVTSSSLLSSSSLSSSSSSLSSSSLSSSPSSSPSSLSSSPSSLPSSTSSLSSSSPSSPLPSSSSEGVQCDDTKGIVCVIDNSNIYIGAQECASAVNPGDRKRNVRVKLQNLVRILEKNRQKERMFVCGSSPPATEHVWEVYRHLGYIVDLEERRGKDEQRVDEGLHLCIYKAICELSPRILVLATGDGMKGKSENATSFPGCASMALERGWHVELYSWKHSLSMEWNKLARRYPDQLEIHFLDSYVNHITFVDGRNGRKCLPFPPEPEKTYNNSQHIGRPMHHNG